MVFSASNYEKAFPRKDVQEDPVKLEKKVESIKPGNVLEDDTPEDTKQDLTEDEELPDGD